MPAILLVDDNAEFLEVLERRFTRRGFAVVCCADAAAATAAAAQGEFDVAIVDRNLRGYDGIELLKNLKRAHARLAVLILSGIADERTAQVARDAGAFGYLVKPCSLADIESAVRRAIAEADGANVTVPARLNPNKDASRL